MTTAKQHKMKIHPDPLAALISGAKTGEVRNDDRGFEVGDTVLLVECNPEDSEPTGIEVERLISHIQRGYGLPDGLCVLSYAQATAAPEQEPHYKLRAVIGGLHGLTWEVIKPFAMPAPQRNGEEWCLYTHPSAEIERLRAENERLSNQRDAILLQARAWAREAKTQQAITREIGEILGGVPNWGPVAAGVEDMRQKLAKAQSLLSKGVLVGRAELSLVRFALKRDAEERGMPARGEMLTELDSSIERFDTLLSATAQPAECAHSNTAQHRTGDGTPVEFCNECGKNTHVGQPAEVKS